MQLQAASRHLGHVFGMTKMLTTAPVSTPVERDGYPSSARAYYVLAVFVLALILSYADRVVLAMLVDPIRASLGISDFQISLLYGFAFGVCFTVVGVPMGWLADRYNRCTLIAGSVLIFSFATAATAITRTFGQMFFARVGLGASEAALNPAVYSLLADYFPPASRPRVYSIYLSSSYVGAGLATFGAGVLVGIIPTIELPVLGILEPWQIIFGGLGLLGIPLFLLVLTVRELPRKEVSSALTPSDQVSFKDTVRHVWHRRAAYITPTLGYAVFAVVVFAYNAWLPALLMRSYAWSPVDIGKYLGIITVVGGVGGALTGSVIADRFRRNGHADANLRVGFWAAVVIAPFAALAPLMPSGGACMLLYAGVMYVGSLPYGVAIAAMMDITPNRMRGQVSALFFLGVNLIGLAGGPSLVGASTDFIFDGDIARSIGGVSAVMAPLAAVLIWLGLRPYREVLAGQ